MSDHLDIISRETFDRECKALRSECQRWRERARAAEKALGDANAEIGRLRALVPHKPSRAFGKATPAFLRGRE